MAHFSTEERISMIQLYYSCNGDLSEAIELWVAGHSRKARPSKAIVENFVKHFEKTGTVKHEINSSLNPLTGEIIPIREVDPCPYLIQTMRQLNKSSPTARFELAKLVQLAERTTEFKLENVWFTSMATFSLLNYSFRNIYRFWGTSRPEILTASPLSEERICAWAGICGGTLLGPYFVPLEFKEDDFFDFMGHQVLPDIHTLEMDTVDYWWMQDLPTRLKSPRVFSLLASQFAPRHIFSDRVKEMLKDGQDWPKYSPDLNPVDFYLWGLVKDRLDQIRPQSVTELGRGIGAVFDEVRKKPDTLIKVIDILRKRLEVCRKSEGWHFEKMFY